MRFVRNAAIPVILIAAIALMAGCSKVPTLAIQDAEASLGKLQAAGAATISAAAPALAQTFPARPVTLLVPFPAGGPTDITMRTLAEVTAPHLGQPVVVEHRPGAGGTLGLLALTNARPDGYTLAQLPLSVFRIPHTQKVTWNPLTDVSYVVGVSGYTWRPVWNTNELNP